MTVNMDFAFCLHMKAPQCWIKVDPLHTQPVAVTYSSLTRIFFFFTPNLFFFPQLMWVFDEEVGMNQREITFVPGLYKIFDEILGKSTISFDFRMFPCGHVIANLGGRAHLDKL